MTLFYAKDYIETKEGLRFAILKNGEEQGRVLCFLRYAFLKGNWKKVATNQANDLLKKYYPYYLYYSKVLDANLHAVEISQISQHYQARTQLQKILNKTPKDKPSVDLVDLCLLFTKKGIDLTQMGITGSLSVDMQTETSDIDLVFYDREVFHLTRKIIAQLIKEDKLQNLAEVDWQEAFARRGCELNFADYLWHEKRKFNKALINGRKFDISLTQFGFKNEATYHKCGKIILKAKVTDDRYSFDYPAKFLIEHAEIQSIICFTATYNGQAQIGEWVEISGQLERSTNGELQIVVGATREAIGEYIKVIK